MIVRSRLNFWQMLLARHGTVLAKIWQPLLVLGLWSFVVSEVHRYDPRLAPGHAPGPYTLIGVALSIFFSFRNNACYERWWEGRKQWGRLVSTTRHFARQAMVLQAVAPGTRERLVRLTIAFVHALVAHLRPGYGLAAALTWLEPAEQAAVEAARNRPDAVIRLISRALAEGKDAGHIGEIGFQMFDRTVQEMSSVQGACERIRSSPVPFSYNQLLQRTTFVFLLALPLAFVDIFGYAVFLAELVIAYVFLGLDVLGDELEQPFGEQPNNLPLAALAATIELDLRAALGETDLPPPPQPVDFILK